MKRAAIYCRVSTLDQRNESQLYDLRSMAAQRGLTIVQEYTDHISGSRAKRPGLDELLRDARRGKFEVLLIWRFDRLARSVRHFLEVLDELQHLNIAFVSFSEQVDTSSPLGRAMIVILGAIAQLERDIIRGCAPACDAHGSMESGSAADHWSSIATRSSAIASAGSA